jgi:hypothetical protein
MSEANNKDYKSSLVRWYFYITPLFIVLDYFWGFNIRISALDSEPTYKYLYYGFCILCGVLMYIFPNYSYITALFESSINIMMLILILILPYARIITTITEDPLGADFKALQESFSVDSIINIFILVFFLQLSFRQIKYRMSGTFGYDGTTFKK